MSKRKQVPEDLMGAILGGKGASSASSGEEQPSPQEPGSPTSIGDLGENNIRWQNQPERTGITFNLSKQVSRELDKLRLELQIEESIRSSNSEIVELALRLAIEEVRERGQESGLLRNLKSLKEEVHVEQLEESSEKSTEEILSMPAETTDESGRIIRRSVDGSGYIIETTYNEQWETADEKIIGNIEDLAVEEEYIDKEGRIISLARDELGNIFERVTDENSNTLGTRLVREAD